MATVTVLDLCVALDAALSAIPGLRHQPAIADQVNPPMAWVQPAECDYLEAMRGAPVELDIVLLAAPSGTGWLRGQQLLQTYLDETSGTSVKAAIEADKTLGGLVDTLVVTRWYDYGLIEHSGIAYLGAKVRVQVWPSA